MKLQVQNDLLPLLVPILTKCGRSLSTVPVLVGFQLTINGRVLRLVDDNIRVGLYKEIRCEDIAYWLINSNINVVSMDGFTQEEVVPGLTFLTKTLHFAGGNGQTSLTIPKNNSWGLTSNGVPFDLSGEFEYAELTALFLPRNKIHELPPEFSAFRLYANEWITLSSSCPPLCQVTWQASDEVTTISISLIDERLTEHYSKDLAGIGQILLEGASE